MSWTGGLNERLIVAADQDEGKSEIHPADDRFGCRVGKKRRKRRIDRGLRLFGLACRHGGKNRKKPDLGHHPMFAAGERLARAGFRPLVVDWTDRRTLRSLPEVGRILVAVSYDRNSRHSRYQSQVGGLRNLIAAISPDANLCYISTTGVYHQLDGRWVDETAPTHPTREGGRVHLQAEQLLHRLRPHSPSTILRLAGIYGPDRVPRAADVVAGRLIDSPARGT